MPRITVERWDYFKGGKRLAFEGAARTYCRNEAISPDEIITIEILDPYVRYDIPRWVLIAESLRIHALCNEVTRV